jgi:hypothetical protein
MTTGDAIVAGRAAWHRLRDREKATWHDWMIIAEALVVGRTRAMITAQTNKPVGTLYVRAIGAWLTANGFDEINPQERYRAILCLEHREEIEQWRAGLDDAKRRRLNHPAAVWAHWSAKKAKEDAPAADVRQHVVRSGRARSARPISFSADHIRRAAEKMRESGSSDYFTLARLALQGVLFGPRKIWSPCSTSPHRKTPRRRRRRRSLSRSATSSPGRSVCLVGQLLEGSG